MDPATMTIDELEAALTKVIDSEDELGHPDVHTEDYLKAAIAAYHAKPTGTPIFYAEGPFADDVF